MALTNVPASLSATALTLTTAAQPNITSVGTLTGLTVSGNIAGTLTTAAQTNITSLGTLTALNVDNIGINGDTITLTGASATGFLQTSGNTVQVGSSTSDPLVLYTNNTAAITIDTSQNTTLSGSLTLNTGTSGVPIINLSHSNSNADNFRIMAGITGVSNGGFSIYDVDASANRLVINSSGHVGIGLATAPSAPLDVITNSTVWAGEFTQNNTSNGDGVIITVGSTAAADYALSVRSDAGNTPGLNVKANGKVGIGIFAPNEMLHVHESTTPRIAFTDGTTGTAAGGDGMFVGIAGDQGFNIWNYENTYTRFAVNNSEKMRIDANGVVAIGTTDIHNWATFNGLLRVGPRAFFGTTTSSTQVGYNWYYDGAYKYIAGDYANRYIQNDGHHWWQTATSGSADGAISWVSKMRLDRDGKLTLGPDYNDIQIAPASINSGVNSIYLRGNASGEKSQIILNHYGYADYYIGTGLVGNGIFTVGTGNTDARIAVDNSGVVYINPNAILQSANESLKIDGPIFKNAIGSNNTTGVYETFFSATFTPGQTRYIRINIDGNLFGSIQITMTGNYSNVNAIGSFSRVYGVGYNAVNTSNYANDSGGYTVWDRGTTSGKFNFGSQYKPNNTTGYIPISSTEGTYNIDTHITIRMEGSLAGLTSIDIV